MVSLNPLLIAVATNLSKGRGSYPVVKIIRSRLTRIAGSPPAIGMRVATVALYRGLLNLRRWKDFDPQPVDNATPDIDEVNRVMLTFKEADWRRLREGLDRVPKPYRPGLFYIQPPL